jgi:hypothetical protein
MDKFQDSKTVKPTKEGFAQKAGDAIERVGQKVTDMGAPSLGKKIYNAGDSIEHMNDKKP